MQLLIFTTSLTSSTLMFALVTGLPEGVMAHGRPSQTANCHMNLEGPGYHCHSHKSQPQKTPEISKPQAVPKRSQPRRSPKTTQPLLSPKPVVSPLPAPSPSDTTPTAIIPRRGCSLRDRLNVYQQPQQQATVIHQLNRNKCVFLNNPTLNNLSNQPSWVNVTLPDGQRGFVDSNALNKF